MEMSYDMEKEVPNVNDQHEVPEVVSTEKEQADQFESPSEEEEDLLPTSTSNVPNLNDGSLFSVGCRQDSADQLRLTQNSSHNYIAIVTRATTAWTQKMYLEKTLLFNRYVFFVHSVHMYLFFYILL